MLAWEYGYGWMRDPAVPMYGESAGSEDFELTSLAVTAPSADKVAGTGAAAPAQPSPAGAVTHVFSAPGVRDVAVAVGNFTIADATVYGIGALTLQHADNSVGSAAFGAALKTYLHDEAHRIARPEDIKKAFASVPEVVQALQDAGAFTTGTPAAAS
ncbi:MAG: hypothetical protein ACRDV3_06790 [Acidothermaceae bacterium]